MSAPVGQRMVQAVERETITAALDDGSELTGPGDQTTPLYTTPTADSPPQRPSRLERPHAGQRAAG